MPLLIDNREKNVAESLTNLGEEIIFVQLPIGDYLIVSGSTAVIVERKTVKDFLVSIRSNRLWDQLLRMMKTDTVLEFNIVRKILLIHGTFDDYMKTINYGNPEDQARNWAQLMGAFMEIIYVYNTPIIHAENDQAFSTFIRILMKREQAGKNDKLPEARWYRKPARADLPTKDRRTYILSALPYIGNQLAENLLAHFDTISQVACASVKDLQQVPKIGKKKAALIYNMFH